MQLRQTIYMHLSCVVYDARVDRSRIPLALGMAFVQDSVRLAYEMLLCGLSSNFEGYGLVVCVVMVSFQFMLRWKIPVTHVSCLAW